MATHRIVLLITDEEIQGLDSVMETLDAVCQMNEMDDDYATETDHVNGLFRVVEELSNRIRQEVLAS
jgi:hypothetical protein